MKKSWRTVTAFGLQFDVPPAAKFLTADSDGLIKAHFVMPAPKQSIWLAPTKGLFDRSEMLFKVDLEGANWRDCISSIEGPQK